MRGDELYRRGAMYLGPTFDLVGRRYADFANTYEVGSHVLVGVRAGRAIGRSEWFVELRNISDEAYIASVNVLYVASPDARVLYPGAPRSIFAGVRFGL